MRLGRGYIAGFLDGEGTITIARASKANKYRSHLQVQICNTNRRILASIRSYFGYGCLRPPKTTRSRRHKPVWVLQWVGAQAESVVRLVYPWLRVKRKQAQVALVFRSTFSYRGPRGFRTVPYLVRRKRDAALRNIRLLNFRGVLDA